MDDDQVLSVYLADRDEPCPRCGYNLRALTGRRCPECGSALRLRVGLVEPRITAYVVGIGVCFAGVGGASLFSLLALVHAGRDWWFDDFAAILLLVLLASSTVMALIGLLARRQILRCASATQWVMTTLAAAYLLGMFVWIVRAFGP